MSTKYKITKEIHELINQLKTEKGLEIKVDGDLLIDEEGNIESEKEMETYDKWDWLSDNYYPLIQEPQIRQILAGLQEVLESKNQNYTVFAIGEIQIDNQYFPIAQALDDKWFRPVEESGNYTGQSLFNREPETVLTELRDTLKNLNK